MECSAGRIIIVRTIRSKSQESREISCNDSISGGTLRGRGAHRARCTACHRHCLRRLAPLHLPRAAQLSPRASPAHLHCAPHAAFAPACTLAPLPCIAPPLRTVRCMRICLRYPRASASCALLRALLYTRTAAGWHILLCFLRHLLRTLARTHPCTVAAYLFFCAGWQNAS